MGGRGASSGTKTKTYALFHGSPNADISQFDIAFSGRNTSSGEKLLYFTDSKEFADEFSYERQGTSSRFIDKKGNKGRVYEVEVSMKKPLDLTKPSKKDIKNMIAMSDDELTESEILQFSKGNNQLLKTYIDVNQLASYGYDGLIAKVGRGSDALEYGVVSNKQVKIKR